MDDSHSPTLSGGAASRGPRGSVGGPPVGELYNRGEHLFSTRTAEAFEAADAKTGERILLWTLRFPIAADSDSANNFVRRLGLIQNLSIPTPQFRNFGVDARGSAYLAMEYVRGRNVLEQVGNPKLLERTFVEMLQAVAPLHKNGMVLSDISWDSFAIDEKGRVLLWALLGPFESGAKQTAMLPPPETLPFLAPEQRTVTGAEASADVFALGVFGYRLFTGRFLHGDKTTSTGTEDITSMVPAPSTVRGDLPVWVDDVIGRCLDLKPEARFRDANEVLQVIFESIQAGAAPGGGGRWSRRTMIVSPNQRNKAIRPRALDKQNYQPSTVVKKKQKDNVRENVTQAVNMFTWSVGLIIALLGVCLLYFFFDRWNSGSREDECSIITHADYAPPELKPLIFDVTAKGITIEKRTEALNKIAQSKDPSAYAILLALTKCKAESDLKSAAAQLLVDRIRQQGSVRSADVVKKWFETIEAKRQNPADLPVYSLILRSCDLSRAIDTRRQALKEAAAIDNQLALQLSAALSLDEQEDHFVPLLRSLLVEQNPGVNFDGHGAGALIVANATLSKFFASEVPGMLEKFTDEDLLWLLERYSESDNPLGFDVAKEVLKRKSVPPFQAVFLKALVENSKTGMMSPIDRALLHGAVGKITRGDISQYGKWLSMEAEPVLLAAIAIQPNSDLAVEAFDMLSSHSLQTEPANSLIKWVKSQYWEFRKKLAKAIGILGLVDSATETDLNYAFGELMPFAGGGTLFHVIEQTGDERLIRIALERMGEITPSEELLLLLGHKSKSVRIATVKALKGRNDLAILQGILQGYAHEQDEEVRTVYQELHWVTRERDPEKLRR